jgi:hypothetical protein
MTGRKASAVKLHSAYRSARGLAFVPIAPSRGSTWTAREQLGVTSSRQVRSGVRFITEPGVIVDHLEKRTQAKRGPPASTTAVVSAPA